MKTWRVIALATLLATGCNQGQPQAVNRPEAASKPVAEAKNASQGGPFGFAMGMKLDEMASLKLHDLGKNNEWATDLAPGEKGPFTTFFLTISKNVGLCKIDAISSEPADPKPIFDELRQRLIAEYNMHSNVTGGPLPEDRGYNTGDYAIGSSWYSVKKNGVDTIKLRSSIIKDNKTLGIEYYFSNYSACMKDIAAGAQL